MTLVVDPTLPFTSSELFLNNHLRWARLLPLVNPSFIEAKKAATNDYTVLINGLRAECGNRVSITVIVPSDSISIKVLQDSNSLAAITVVRGDIDAGAVVEDVIESLVSSSMERSSKGEIVVLSITSQKNNVQTRTSHGSPVLLVSVENQLQFDQVLSLLSVTTKETK